MNRQKEAVRRFVYVFVCLGLFAVAFVPQARAIEYTTAHPLSSVITIPVKDCGKFTELPVPMLAWVGDMPTIAANGYTETTSSGSIFDRIMRKGVSI